MRDGRVLKEPSHRVFVLLAHDAHAIAGYPRHICNRCLLPWPLTCGALSHGLMKSQRRPRARHISLRLLRETLTNSIC